jgi:recombination associated protein RdgC
MWFTNALICNIDNGDLSSIEEGLKENHLNPCPPHSRFTFGWLESIGDCMVHQVGDFYLVTLGKEERMLPRSVINQALTDKIVEIETNQGKQVTRSEKAHLREELEFELLPKAFCVQKKMLAMIDAKRQRLIINSSSMNQATQLCSLLRKSVANIQIEPLNFDTNIKLKFTNWLDNPHTLPKDFELAPNCILFAEDDDKKRFNCKGYELPSQEVCSLIEQGLLACEISLIWKERIQFTLNSDLILKRIKCVDYLLDELSEVNGLDDELERKDANFVLLSGEFRQLIDDISDLLNTEDNVTQEALESKESPELAID